MVSRLDDLALAHHLADTADAVSTRFFETPTASSQKPDGTRVSVADLAVEEALLDVLRRLRADDAVVSEERGTVAAGGRRRWILDPIDGTEPFLAGARSWGTHIALEVEGVLQIGVITRPTEDRRWWAVRGRGAWSGLGDGATTLTVSDTDVLAAARIAGFVDPGSDVAATIARHGRWTVDPLGPVIGLLEGRVDVVVAPGGAVWDHAPQVLLSTEAGGRYTDPDGGGDIDARGGVYTNGRLTDQVLAVSELYRFDP